MFITLAIHILVSAIAEDGSYFISVFFRSGCIQFLENIIVLTKCFDGIYCKECRVDIFTLWMYMLFMMFKNVFRDLMNTFLIMVQIININFLTFAIFRIVQLFRIYVLLPHLMCKQCSLILDGETKDITVGNCIFDHITMQTGIPFCTIRHQARIEYISGSSAICPFIGFKDRCTCKTNIVGSLEVALNISMHLTEL